MENHANTNIVTISKCVNKCDICDKNYSNKENLKKHFIAIHEGHKDYKCDSFSQAGYLKKHIHTVHKGRKVINVTLVLNHFLKQPV